MLISRKKWNSLNLRVFELEMRISEIEKAQTDIPEWAEECIDGYMSDCKRDNHQ